MGPGTHLLLSGHVKMASKSGKEGVPTSVPTTSCGPHAKEFSKIALEYLWKLHLGAKKI